MTLELATTNPTPSPLTWRRALAELERAHEAAEAAYREFHDCRPGETDRLIQLCEAWHAAELRVELASRREREERMRALETIDNGRSE